MGTSESHSSSVPLVLNLETGAITAQYHVVFDDSFATVATDPSQLPDLYSDEWANLFGNDSHHYVPTEDDDSSDVEVTHSPAVERAYRHSKRVRPASYAQQ